MKTLVVYSSSSGNTGRLARAACAFLPGEVVLEPVETDPSPAGYDLVLVGFWLQAGKADPRASVYLERLASGKVFLFATHGAAPESLHALEAMKGAQQLAAPCEVIGTFNCQGNVAPAFLEKARAKDPQPPWLADADAAAGHPDDSDLDRLRRALGDALRTAGLSAA